MKAKLFTHENLWALLLFLIAVAVLLATTDNTPIWIYQGF
jgi:hypothetical protein